MEVRRAQSLALDICTEIQGFLHTRHPDMPLGEMSLGGSLLDDLAVSSESDTNAFSGAWGGKHMEGEPVLMKCVPINCLFDLCESVQYYLFMLSKLFSTHDILLTKETPRVQECVCVCVLVCVHECIYMFCEAEDKFLLCRLYCKVCLSVGLCVGGEGGPRLPAGAAPAGGLSVASHPR